MSTIETKIVVTDQLTSSLSQFSAMAQIAKRQTDSMNSSVRMLGMNANNSVGNAAALGVNHGNSPAGSSAMALNSGNSPAGSASMAVNNANNSVGSAAALAVNNMRQLDQQTNAMVTGSFSNLQTQASRVVEITQKVTEEEKKHKEELKSAEKVAQKLTGSIKKMVSAAAGKLKMAAPVIELSDNIVRMNARMELINDGTQTTKELENSIYESAQRVRLPYLDVANMVSGLGGTMGDVFSSNNETIGFVENFGKLFAIAGAGQEDIKAAAEQLTQALSDGVLKGDEMNAVFKKAPSAVETIAGALGVDVKKLGEMATNGELSAGVLKNAMLSATGDIAQKFNEMPATWNQVWTNMKSGAIKALQPALEKLNEFLNSDTGSGIIEGVMSSFELLSDIASGAVDLLADGASFIAENWDCIWPIIVGVGAAFAIAGIIGAASGLATAVSWLIAAWPFLLIAALIAGLIIVLGEMGVTFEQVGGVIGAVFGLVYATGYNMFADLWNLIAIFVEFFANVFNDPVTAIARLFFDLFDTILGTVENIAAAIDTVTGSDMAGAVAGFRNNMSDWVNDNFDENKIKIERMSKIDARESALAGAEIGAGLGKKLDGLGKGTDGSDKGLGDLFSGKDLEDTLKGGGVPKVGKVGEVDKVNSAEDVNIADEDIKLLQDLSERQYVALVNLTAPSPISINQNNYGGSGGDVEEMAGQLARLLEQERNNKPTVVYG